MNGRAVAADLAALAAVVLWVYGGTAVLVARIGDGQAASFGAAAAVVIMSYGLARLLQQLDIDDSAFRLWGDYIRAAAGVPGEEERLRFAEKRRDELNEASGR